MPYRPLIPSGPPSSLMGMTRRWKRLTRWLAAGLLSVGLHGADWPERPLSLEDCLETALSQSPAIARSRQDVEEAHGVSLQQRATFLPSLQATGAYNRIDENKIERVAFGPPGAPAVPFANNQNWNALLTVSQPIYAGGRLRSAARASRLTREAALAAHQAVVADALLEVRVAYQDVLLAAEQITVQEASIELLQRELTDTTRRFEAGAVPRFNVLRAEVELANARPRLIRARNQFRIAKNTLANLLGYSVPDGVEQDIPLELNGRLAAEPFDVPLATAIGRALDRRPELAALSAAEGQRREEIRQARANYLPQLSGIAGYGWQNRNFVRDLDQELQGWNLGAQLTWNIWDSGLTRGRVTAARARAERARIDVEDTRRKVELEVRTAHSTFQEAREVLDSQQKVNEQAEEALRLAIARSEAGTGTQLDVLSAQTALTEARNTYRQALRDFSVARARLERAMGEGVTLEEAP